MHRSRRLATLFFLILPLLAWALSGWGASTRFESLIAVQTPGSRDPDPLVKSVIDQVSRDELRDLVGGLSGAHSVSIGGQQITLKTRYTPSEHGALAEQYAYEYFRSLGLNTLYQDWTGHTESGSGYCTGLTGRNVVAEIPGKADRSRIYMLAAHLDSMSPYPTENAPGADDNGSGSAAVMLAARILRGYTFDYTVRLVLFTGEERGVCGSNRYAHDARERNEDIRGAVLLDMIAYDSDGVKDVEIHAGTREDSKAVAGLLAANIETYDLDLVPHVFTDGATNRSDHASFWAYDYPAVLGIEYFLNGDMNPYYHSVTCCDTLEHMDLGMAADFTKAGIATVSMLAGVRGSAQGSPAPPTPQPTTPPSLTPTLPPPIPTAVPTIPVPGTGSRAFPETGEAVGGLFLDYWQNNGGLPQQGYPISGVMGEISDLNGNPYTVQYFERAVFEYHPDNRPPYDVLLSQFGTFQYRRKYPNGAPNQKPNQANGHYFPETGHRVGGKFWEYWQAHGGLPQQGYPISDEFTEVSDLNGRPYTVQYFERAVFELHPENPPPYDVLLSQLGKFQYWQKHGAR